MSEWQPISTAPKVDGENKIIVYHPKFGVEVRLADGEWWRMEATCSPTHWMPLPEPPTGDT
jgi:hypothetical protein